MYKDMVSVTAVATEVKAIQNSIKNILLTRKGSLPGKPRFGSNLYNIIFSQLDHLTESIARNYIKEALAEYETRITVKDIKFTRAEEYNRLVIEIIYSYRDDKFNNEVASTSIAFNL